jgi:hypothetical protein
MQCMPLSGGPETAKARLAARLHTSLQPGRQAAVPADAAAPVAVQWLWLDLNRAGVDA